MGSASEADHYQALQQSLADAFASGATLTAPAHMEPNQASVVTLTIPADFAIQIQTGLLVTERAWCDLVSYSGGLPLACIRAFPDPVIQDAIITAAGEFEARLADALSRYREAVAKSGAVQTKRINREILL